MSFYAEKTALVTGAAQGLGFEIAKRLAARGCDLFICDVQAGKLVAAQDQLMKAYPSVRIVSLAGDLREPSFPPRLEAAFDAFSKQLDILVNNAGVVFGGLFLDRQLAEHKATYDINTWALVEMTYRFLPRLLKSPEARLLQISSATGFIALPYGTTYASSKWAVTGFSDSLRLELKQAGHQNIRVKIVTPSYISTGMFDGSKPPRLMPPLDPGQLADKIISFLPGSRVFLKEPFMVKSIRFIQGVCPLWMQDWVLKVLGVQNSMSHWKGHKTAGPTKFT